MNTTIQQRAQKEIVDMHAFFVQWFSGQCQNHDHLFHQNLRSHFSNDFQIIFPNGSLLGPEHLFSQMQAGHGNNPTFRISIRNVQTRTLSNDNQIVLATYQEWQKHALNSQPQNNGRLTTAIFRQEQSQPNGLTWLHIHETWLPNTLIQNEPFEF